MFNSDLDNLKEVLFKLNNMDIDKILFYDLSVISLANKLNINKELVIVFFMVNLYSFYLYVKMLTK